ncbi:PIN-like domain-containing protein [Corynebacterium sp. H127]|uniref:PIN-like domain-containing protein n=1 Tax=Corynebacterium sp. H127 TaxID=3133418 RepID=UPI00403F579D
MRFAIDANESPLVCRTWETLFRPHEFVHIRDLNLNTLPDIELYSELVNHEFDALITRDRRQLVNPDERQALEQSGLTWIGHKEPKGQGIQLISQLISSYCLALPHIIFLMDKTGSPLKFVVKNQPRSPQQIMSAWHLNNFPYTAVQLPR